MILHRLRGPASAAALALLILTGCGSDSTSSDDSGAPGTTPGDASVPSTAAPSGTTSSDDCPISADALTAATALRWELRERREDHPLETAESVKATVCVFTASDAPQLGGDPLVLRTDVVTGPDAAAERSRFGDTCVEFGGTTQPSGGATVCARGGTVVEGIKGEGDRLVNVYLVNADTATATDLTPAFARILAVVA